MLAMALKVVDGSVRANGFSALTHALTPAWMREPLLHFVLLGVLLFALDQAIVGRSDDPRLIVVGAAVDAEASQIFEAARGRAPTAEELDALRRAWLDNEVLYREGLALQVDKGDTAIRERVIFKALSVVNTNIKAPAIDETGLRAWFEARRIKYDEPTRFDFQEAVLADDSSERGVRSFVELLNRGTPETLSAGLRVFKGRPHSNLVQGYGEAFARDFESALVGEWRAYETRDGWRAMQLVSLTPAKPASFEDLRGVVLQDWTDATMSEQRSAAVRALAKKYNIKREVGLP
jgi:hypothetical protein